MFSFHPYLRSVGVAFFAGGMVLACADADTSRKTAPPVVGAGADLASNRAWPEAAKYHLPWPGRVSVPVFQGNFGAQTHLISAHNYYAWDFGMNPGDLVCAGRNGVVYRVFDSGTAVGDKENIIEVQHEDGEFSVYSHIQTGSALVKRGDHVQAGQTIAKVGDLKHLHFVVWDKSHMTSIPAGFFEVKEKAGVPLDGRSYTSQAPRITPKTVADGMKRLLNAEALRVQNKTAAAIAGFQKLAESDLIAGNDREKARRHLAELGEESMIALAAARALAGTESRKEAKARAQEVARNFAGLPAAEEARMLLRDLARAEREGAAVDASR